MRDYSELLIIWNNKWTKTPKLCSQPTGHEKTEVRILSKRSEMPLTKTVTLTVRVNEVLNLDL